MRITTAFCLLSENYSILAYTGFCRLLEQRFFAGACAQYVYCTISIQKHATGMCYQEIVWSSNLQNPVSMSKAFRLIMPRWTEPQGIQ